MKLQASLEGVFRDTFNAAAPCVHIALKALPPTWCGPRHVHARSSIDFCENGDSSVTGLGKKNCNSKSSREHWDNGEHVHPFQTQHNLLEAVGASQHLPTRCFNYKLIMRLFRTANLRLLL
ncbi:hypothetical protein CY34DRAFT_300303 [Suillus luteus UH-Slu-Lm8-n1]|uniref:Unplaced genomic scaffold CY34scaffold_195, whole genome shotgun sequence n=1 Tax=Suillus luteus UH-Slu-Lm8-n1 TaxID=930992 RepID=A0A0D0B7P8_9AGAM|nr:hypothetical protein CY34DRAFT_300303 [Suillus luteus UH-Slu-Lm8-n1]